MAEEYSNCAQAATLFMAEGRYVPEEFREALTNPLFDFLTEKYGTHWGMASATTPLFLEVLENWFLAFCDTVDALRELAETDKINPKMLKALAHSFENHKQEMIEMRHFMYDTCRTDPTVVGHVRDPEKAISNLPDGHLLRKLYGLKGADETCSDWLKRTGITSLDVYDAMESGPGWDLMSRRFVTILREYGAKWDNRWLPSPTNSEARGAALS